MTANFSRTAGQSAIEVEGTGLGSAAPGAGVGNLFATTAPTLVSTTAPTTAINAASHNTQIAPAFVGVTTAMTTGALGGTGAANTFVNYTAAGGFRPLNPTDEFDVNPANVVTGDNTYITIGTVTSTATTAVNSLVLTTASTAPVLAITSGTTLTNTSGALLFGGATGDVQTVGASVRGGTLNFGSNEAVITVNGGAGGLISSAITGSGGLTKSGAGVLQINGANTFTGPVNVAMGTLALADLGIKNGSVNDTAIPTGGTVNVANGAIFYLDDTLQDNPSTINYNNFTINLNGGGSLVYGNANIATFNLPGNIVLTGANTIQTNNIADTLNAFGVISGNGSLTAHGEGAGAPHVLQLSGANTYTGSTTIFAGGAGQNIRLAGGDNRLPVGTTLTITSNSGNTAQLDLGGTNQTLAGLLATGATGSDSVVNSSTTLSTLILNIASGTTNTYAGLLGTTANTSFGVTATGTNFALTKAGAGTLVLGGADGYTGATTVNAGILTGSTTAAIPTGSTTTVASGAQLNLTAAGNYNTFPVAITGQGPTTTNFDPANNAGALRFNNNISTFTFNGPITISGANAEISNYGVTNTLNLGGVISGAVTDANGLVFGAAAAGAGQNNFVLGAAETYTGATTLIARAVNSTLQLGAGGSLPATTTLTLKPDGGLNAGFDLNGNNQTLAGLVSGTGLVGTGASQVLNSSATASTLTVNNTAANTFAGIIGGTGANNNNLSLIKSGSGTLTLTGANTFTGATTINAGTLALAGGTGVAALGGTGSIAINTGTLLLSTANQTNNGATITMSGGMLSVAAGASQGTASTVTNGGATGSGGTSVQGLGALTLNSTATLAFGGTATTLVFGNFTPNGNVLNVTGYSNTTATGGNSGGAGDDRLVFSVNQSANLADFNFGQGAGVGVSEVQLDGNFYEVVGAVPEPSTWVGGLLGLGMIGFSQRRRVGVWLGLARLS